MYKFFVCWVLFFCVCEGIVELPLNTDYANPESVNTEFLLNVQVPSSGVMITVLLDEYHSFNICADTQPITVDPPCSYARWQGVTYDFYREITIPPPFEKQVSETESIYIYLDPRYKSEKISTTLFANLLPGEDISHLAVKKGTADITYLLLTSDNAKAGNNTNWYYLNVDSFITTQIWGPTVTLTLQSCFLTDFSFGIGSARASNTQNITAGFSTEIIPGYIYEPIVLYTNWTIVNENPAMLQTVLEDMPPPRLLYFSPPTGYYELIIKIMPDGFSFPDENIVHNVRVNDDLLLRFRSRNAYYEMDMNYAIYVGDGGVPTIKDKCGYSKYTGQVEVLNENTYITLVAPNFFQHNQISKYAIVESSADFAFPEYYAPTFITTETYTQSSPFCTGVSWVLIIIGVCVASIILIILFKGILAVAHKCCKKSTPVPESQFLLETQSDE